MTRRSDSDAPLPWAHLLHLYLLMLSGPRPHWTEFWRLFEQEPYYLGRVTDNCRLYLRGKNRSDDWLDDMQSEVRDLFGHELCKHPDLGMDVTRIRDTFPAFLDAIIVHLCSKAYAALSRRRARRRAKGLPPPRRAAAADYAQQLDQCRDVNWALEQLGEPCSSLLRLFGTYSPQEMAEAAGISYLTMKRRVDRCREKLRRILKDYENDTENG
jgi:hypothetical protein